MPGTQGGDDAVREPQRVSALDVVVVGAGQAGLGISYFLHRDGLAHVVLEKGTIGHSWRTQRWDSFTLNTPNWASTLPGDPYDGPDRDGFWTTADFVASLERYAERFELPVRTGVEVTSVEPIGDGFEVRAVENGDEQVLHTANVVIASGILQAPKVPDFATRVPEGIASLHAGSYRSPGALPDGAVLVVGSAQSGCQIAEDLLAGGRRVFLSCSKVARVPRRYRGRDMIRWFVDVGVFDMTPDQLEDPAEQLAPQPQISGIGPRGKSLSLQELAGRGVTLLGRAVGLEDGRMRFDEKLAEYVAFADERSATFKGKLEAFIERTGLDVEPYEPDPIDVPDPNLDTDAPTSLDLAGAGVGAIVWCTGFTADFSWIHAPVTGEDGRPVHERGVSPVPGVYFLGFPWLHKRKSGIILGIEEDAGHVADVIRRRATAAGARGGTAL